MVKGYLRGCAMYFFIITFLMAAFLAYRSYQNTTRIRGRVIDKETGKPVPYTLIKMAIGYDGLRDQYIGVAFLEWKTVVANEKGKYEIVSKNVPSKYMDIKTMLEGRHIPRDGQEVSAWFPGYKKWEWNREGWKLYRGKLDIALERPKTPAEAVDALRPDYRILSNPFPLKENEFYAEAMNASSKIIKDFPKSKYADEAWLVLESWAGKAAWAQVSDQTPDREKAFKIKWDILQHSPRFKEIYMSVPCDNLIKYQNACLEKRKN